MSLTSNYFDIINGYRKAVSEAQRKADEKILLAEKAKGSPLYDELMKEAAESLAEAAKTAREAAIPKFRETITAMRDNIGKQKPTPPTAEMLERLQFLKMRDENSITYDELRDIAAFCQDNPSAMQVVNDMAKKKGFVLPNIKETVGGDLCAKAVDGLEKSGSVCLNLPKVNNTTAWYQMWKSHITGVNDETGGQAFEYFKNDRDYATEDDILKGYGGLTPDNLVEAKSIING